MSIKEANKIPYVITLLVYNYKKIYKPHRVTPFLVIATVVLVLIKLYYWYSIMTR